MKPLEVERPWIKKADGKKILSVIVIILIATLGILSVFDFYSGSTVNIQVVNVTVTDSSHTVGNFSFAYGKFTYGGRTSVSIDVIMTPYISEYIHTHNIDSYAFTTDTTGFSHNSGISTFTNDSGTMETTITVLTPGQNYFGSLNITILLNQ